MVVTRGTAEMHEGKAGGGNSWPATTITIPTGCSSIGSPCAAIDVIAAQGLPIELQPVGIVIVVAGQEFPPPAFPSCISAVPRVTTMALVADEIDAGEAGGGAVGHGK